MRTSIVLLIGVVAFLALATSTSGQSAECLNTCTTDYLGASCDGESSRAECAQRNIDQLLACQDKCGVQRNSMVDEGELVEAASERSASRLARQFRTKFWSDIQRAGERTEQVKSGLAAKIAQLRERAVERLMPTNEFEAEEYPDSDLRNSNSLSQSNIFGIGKAIKKGAKSAEKKIKQGVKDLGGYVEDLGKAYLMAQFPMAYGLVRAAYDVSKGRDVSLTLSQERSDDVFNWGATDVYGNSRMDRQGPGPMMGPEWKNSIDEEESDEDEADAEIESNQNSLPWGGKKKKTRRNAIEIESNLNSLPWGGKKKKTRRNAIEIESNQNSLPWGGKKKRNDIDGDNSL